MLIRIVFTGALYLSLATFSSKGSSEVKLKLKELYRFKEGLNGELRGVKAKDRRPSPELFGTYLAHGDYIVMRGKALQKYYEHAVTPDKDLRFAVTSRHVIPEMVPSDQRQH